MYLLNYAGVFPFSLSFSPPHSHSHSHMHLIVDRLKLLPALLQLPSLGCCLVLQRSILLLIVHTFSLRVGEGSMLNVEPVQVVNPLQGFTAWCLHVM